MIEKIEVQNYRGFKDNIIFDLHSSKKYKNNVSFIENGIVKKSLIFGKNGSGKSNICFAIMDITIHLVDKEKLLLHDDFYLCANSIENKALFKYHFKFGKKKVIYEYAKRTSTDLCYEKLYIGDKQVLEYDYYNDSHNFIDLPGTDSLNLVKLPTQLSMIKYIYSNTIQDDSSVIKQIINFVNGMLLFKSLSEGNSYMGYTLGQGDMSRVILSKGKLQDFQEFLGKFGINYKLVPMTDLSGKTVIGVDFGNKVLNFSMIISSGTRTIWLFYCWLLEFKKISFLIIDEFDAYYHYELSEEILKIINSYNNYQSVVTTHNTYLMRNEVTRPDCCFIIKDNKSIVPICKLTKKEIRESNNIEKMYRDGEFTNY